MSILSQNLMSNFSEFLQEDRVRIFDGAMGTMLYNKGVYINRSYDELNLSSPDLVTEIHREYLKAGAEIIETNTFGASRLKLAQQGLDDRLAEINVAAAKLARQAIESARHDAFVAGAISPLGVRIEPYGPTSMDEAQRNVPRTGTGFARRRRRLFRPRNFSRFSRN